MHAGSWVIHVWFPHCGESVGSSTSPAMSSDHPDPAATAGAARTPGPQLGPQLGPRLGRPWLVLLLIGAIAVALLRGEGPASDAWQLSASGAAITVFFVLLAKSFDLVVPKARPSEQGDRR